MTTITINHCDYSNTPSFSRVATAAFGGVAVLPNAEVMGACLRQGGRRSLPVEIVVIHDSDDKTAYRVGGQFGELIVIDAADGSFRQFDLGASDEDSEREVDSVLAELAAT